MEPIITGALIGAGANLLGGLLGKKSHDKASQTNQNIANQNIQQQREFAQHGVRWKVEDAARAGINPLVALGAQTTGFSPVHVGATGDTSMPNALSNMGQDIGRAVAATSTAPEKQLQKIQIASAQADLDGKLIDNQLRLSALAKRGNSPSFPGQPVFGGQGDSSDLVVTKPSERTATVPGSPSQQAGHISDVGYAYTEHGLAPVPSSDVKERIEDQMVPEAMWAIRNNLLPSLGFGKAPPKDMLPKGSTHWEFNALTQTWQPQYPKKGVQLDRMFTPRPIGEWFRKGGR